MGDVETEFQRLEWAMRTAVATAQGFENHEEWELLLPDLAAALCALDEDALGGIGGQCLSGICVAEMLADKMKR